LDTNTCKIHQIFKIKYFTQHAFYFLNKRFICRHVDVDYFRQILRRLLPALNKLACSI